MPTTSTSLLRIEYLQSSELVWNEFRLHRVETTSHHHI